MRLPQLSRRSFLKGAAAATAAVAPAAAAATAVSAVSVLPGCTRLAGDFIYEPYVVDAEDAVNILDSFTYDDKTFAFDNVWFIPVGNTLVPAEGKWIPVIAAESSGRHLAKGAVFSLKDGSLKDVLTEPVGEGINTVIYDIKGSDSVYAWVELDLVTRDWKLYASAFINGRLSGTPYLLWEADSNYDPAPFTVSDKTVVWQVQPSLSGDKTMEYSHAYLWKRNYRETVEVLESPGRFSTAPVLADDVCVLTPRVLSDEGVYYGVCAYLTTDDFATLVDCVVMPKSVKPFRAARVGDRFLISVEASYSSGGLLGQMGTYIGNCEQGFYRLSREPSECGAAVGNTFLIKSTSAYLVIDLDKETYSTLTAYDRSLDYGEYPARIGSCSTFVTFSTIKDATTGKPSQVVVRTPML